MVVFAVRAASRAFVDQRLTVRLLPPACVTIAALRPSSIEKKGTMPLSSYSFHRYCAPLRGTISCTTMGGLWTVDDQPVDWGNDIRRKSCRKVICLKRNDRCEILIWLSGAFISYWPWRNLKVFQNFDPQKRCDRSSENLSSPWCCFLCSYINCRCTRLSLVGWHLITAAAATKRAVKDEVACHRAMAIIVTLDLSWTIVAKEGG